MSGKRKNADQEEAHAEAVAMSGKRKDSDLLQLRLPPDILQWLLAKGMRERLPTHEIALLALRRMMESEADDV